MAQGIPAGWYEDPAGSGGWRWWDGTQWTGHVAPGTATPTPERRSNTIVLVAAGGAMVALLAVAVVVAVPQGGGAGSLEVVGEDSPAARVGLFSGVALPEAPSAPSADATWSQDLEGWAADIGIFDGSVYVLTGHEAGEGSFARQLTAFDLDSGEQLWERRVAGAAGSAVIGAGDERLVLTSNGHVPQGELGSLAVFAPDGEELWQESYREDSVPFPFVLPGERLLLQRFAGADSTFRIVAADTGELELEADGTLLARHGSRHLVREPRGIAVIDDEGQRQWSRAADDLTQGQAVIGDGVVFLLDGGRLLALEDHSGEELWSVEFDAEGFRQVLHLPGIGVAARGDGSVRAHDLDGEHLWERSLPGSVQVLVRDSTVQLLHWHRLVPNGDRALELDLLEAASGEVLSRRRLSEDAFLYDGGSEFGDPVGADALIVQEGGAVTAVDLENFEDQWTLSHPAEDVFGAVMASDAAVLLTGDGADRTRLRVHR